MIYLNLATGEVSDKPFFTDVSVEEIRKAITETTGKDCSVVKHGDEIKVYGVDVADFSPEIKTQLSAAITANEAIQQ